MTDEVAEMKTAAPMTIELSGVRELRTAATEIADAATRFQLALEEIKPILAAFATEYENAFRRRYGLERLNLRPIAVKKRRKTRGKK